jgi:hypothetical protein
MCVRWNFRSRNTRTRETRHWRASSVCCHLMSQKAERNEMMPSAMSNTPAIRTRLQLSLNTRTPNRNARMASNPTTTKIRDSEVLPLHRKRLQGCSGHEQGKDGHGRPKLGEALRNLHERCRPP